MRLVDESKYGAMAFTGQSRLPKMVYGGVRSVFPTVRYGTVFKAGYILFQLRPHHANFNKRLVKAPKLYFTMPVKIKSGK